MTDPPHIHEGNWIVSFRCPLDGENKGTWQYSNKDRWRYIDSNNEEQPLVKLAKTRKKLANSSSASLATDLKDRSGALLEWLLSKRAEKSIEDDGMAILLNHIVVSKSTKPLTVLATVVGNQRSVEIRGLASGQPGWFYTQVKPLPSKQKKRQAPNVISKEPQEAPVPAWKTLLGQYVLAFPKLFFEVPEDPSATKSEESRASTFKKETEYEPVLSAHRQWERVSVLRYEVKDNSFILDLRLEFKLCGYVRGALCNCIPIPGKPIKKRTGEPEEPVGVYSPEVVVTSPSVQETLKALSDVWQDRAKAVLVSGPPGSGKERYALSIPYGSGRTKEDVPTISLASGSTNNLERQIFGYRQEDGSIEDGLVEKAAKKAVFIDEAHYPKKKVGIRASLLRVLEANEYYPVDSLVLRKADDVQWVFASSLPLDGDADSLSQVPPRDFWTRMTHVVRIDHPLDLRPFQRTGAKGLHSISKEQEKVLKDLFRFMWWDRMQSHFDIAPMKMLCPCKEDQVRDLDTSEHLYRIYVGKLLTNDRTVQDPVGLDLLAHNFAEAVVRTIGSTALGEVSIRGLRSMVSRIFSKCVSQVTAGNDKWAETLKEDDLCEIVKEIQSIARLKRSSSGRE
ncbi:MAG TPA: sigma 54-interacting transcriptional regulator [Candidatus Hydrogenedentes bacterium]|nr:sigma 54-interacting transcriptional regulator [Candidatus Hydrogenedentota bacterium]HPG66501.1 sigma 54-interacting transcriptional regulator [Candidatus Hydrogenedentota bacterium]